MKVTGTKLDTDLNWLKIFRSTFEHNGHTGEWLFVSRKKKQTKAEKNKADAVVIVPFICDNEGKVTQILLTKEFRVPINDHEIGFPAGLLDPGEAPFEAACRELLEETGYLVLEHMLTSPPIISSAGMSDESVQLVFVEARRKRSAQPEKTEDIQIVPMNVDEVEELLFSKKKIGAKAWPILFTMTLIGIHGFHRMIKRVWADKA